MTTTWLTPREAADYARVTPITLKRAVQSRRLNAYRVNGGRLLRYRREDLDAWLSLAPAVEKQS